MGRHPADGPQLASNTFARPIEFAKVPVLHQGYLEGLPEKEGERLLTWMSKTFQVPKHPRPFISDGAGFGLTPEIGFIVQNCDSYGCAYQGIKMLSALCTLCCRCRREQTTKKPSFSGMFG